MAPISNIASDILEYRSTLRGRALSTAHLVERWGADGVQEALRRRWLAVDESGFGTLATTQIASHIHAMNEAMNDPQEFGIGDEVQIVGRDGRPYAGVISTVGSDRSKVKVAFTGGTPPGDAEDVDYDASEIKVTKKTAPDDRQKPSPTTPPASPATAPSPATSSLVSPKPYNGLLN